MISYLNGCSNHCFITKKRKYDQKGIDRLSDLPDSLVEHILSFLPTLDAVQTMLLSKRFQHSWTWIHTLSFEEEKYGEPRVGWNVFEGKRFCNVISKILELHNGPQIKRLRLHCFVRCPDQTLRTEVRDWLQLLLTDKQLQACELRFGRQRDHCLNVIGIVPQCTFNGRFLTELRLSNCTVNLKRPAKLVSMKVLSFYRVYFKGGTLKCIISGCPILEGLRIAHCSSKLCRVTVTSPTIQKLSLENPMHLKNVGLVKIKCPNLMSLSLRSMTPVKILEIPSYVVATIFMAYANVFLWKRLIKKIQNLDVITVGGWVAVTYAYFSKKKRPCPYNVWKSVKVVNLKLNEISVPWICCLLSFSPCLEEFLIDCKYGGVLRSLPQDIIEGAVLERIDSTSSVEFDYLCLRKHLKKFVIRGYTKQTYKQAIELAEFILKNACVLEEFVIESSNYCVDRLTRKQMNKFDKAISSISPCSTQVNIHRLCPSFHY